MLVKMKNGIKVEKYSLENPMAIKYTAGDMPQQNLVVEVGFCALTNKAHATMHHANLPMEKQYHMFVNFFTTVNFLDSLTIIELNCKHTSRYVHFWVKCQALPITFTLWEKAVQ